MTVTFGQLAGVALILLVVFLGLALLFYGWPSSNNDYDEPD